MVSKFVDFPIFPSISPICGEIRGNRGGNSLGFPGEFPVGFPGEFPMHNPG